MWAGSSFPIGSFSRHYSPDTTIKRLKRVLSFLSFTNMNWTLPDVGSGQPGTARSREFIIVVIIYFTS